MALGNNSKLTAWTRLMRPPNLFTVPGDAAAGYLLGSLGTFSADLLGAGIAVILLYIGGLLLNDYYDRDIDAKERPFRPIPSGAVTAKAVKRAGWLFMHAAVVVAFISGGLAPAAAAFVLGILIYIYDSGQGKGRFSGPIFMGLCRAGSVAFGAVMFSFWSFPGNVILWIAVGCAFVYTALVTLIAAGEMESKNPGKKAYLPGASLLVCTVLIIVFAPWEIKSNLQTILLFGVAACEALLWARQAIKGEIATPALIGRLIRVMITIQAAWILWSPGGLSIPRLFVVLIIMFILRVGADSTGRRFYGS